MSEPTRAERAERAEYLGRDLDVARQECVTASQNFFEAAARSKAASQRHAALTEQLVKMAAEE